MARPKLEKPIFRLGRYKGKPNWYVKWTLNGKPDCKSTGTENENEAKQFLLDIEISWSAPPLEKEITITEVLDIYLKYKREEYIVRGEDVNHWKSNYKKLEAEIDSNKEKSPTIPPSIRDYFGYMRVSQLHRQKGRDYVLKLKEMGLSNATTAKRLSILNAALNYCADEKIIVAPSIIQLPPAPPPKQRIASAEEISHFLSVCSESVHLETFCIVVLNTLSRKAAVLGLKWEQVNFETRMIEFNPPGRFTTKKKRITTLMNELLLAQLRKAYRIRTTDYVIEWWSGSVMEIGKTFRFYAQKAGMPWLTPHILRHTGASLLAASEVPMEKIAELMGDTVETTRKHYIKYSPKYLKEATDKLNDIYSEKG